MKVVVTGATGNKGTSILEALGADSRVTEIVGLARRMPTREMAKTRWVGADVAEAELEPVFAGAAAVIHLAWLIQPSRDQRETERPFLPSPLLRPGLLPVVPDVDRLRVQAVHSPDVAGAYRRAALDEQARGAYNIAAEPVLDPATLAQALGARRVPVSARVLRAFALATL